VNRGPGTALPAARRLEQQQDRPALRWMSPQEGSASRLCALCVPPVELALARSSQKEAVGDIGEVDSDDSRSYPVDNVTAESVILIEQHPLVPVVILGWPIVLNTENTWNIESPYGRLDAG
jgi:hypothetical protein